jgi:hypothetical protein
MKTVIAVISALACAMAFVPSDAEAARTVVRHHQPVHHPVHRPVAPVHHPVAPVHHPVGGVHRTVVIGAGYRPVHPWWRPGGAIAAGAAIGYVTAATVTWAGPPPGPTYCWYYTDWTKTKGFWDICPY